MNLTTYQEKHNEKKKEEEVLVCNFNLREFKNGFKMKY